MKTSLSVGIALLLVCNVGHAFPNIRDAWAQIYPESRAIDLNCQLCHVNTNGGEPWNAYGWGIRQEIRSGESREQAIVEVQFDNSDGDSRDIENLDEIIRNFQPGWRLGNTNMHFFEDGSTTSNNPPPDTSGLPGTAIDFPSAVVDPIPSSISASGTTLALEEVANGFQGAIRAVRAPGINGSMFVVEQGGNVFRTDLATGTRTLFFNAGANLVSCGECGLLGLAFHPNFQNNGLLYTYQSETIDARPTDFTTLLPSQTPNHQSKIVEYRVSDPSCNSQVTRRRTVLIIDQPQGNHNGGDLVFDDQGRLYISLGDGGGASDFGRGHGPLGNGRNNETVLGSILRIDPLGNNSANGLYGIPPSNPFLNSSGVDEIYAYGFRNPFRMSFDAQTGELYTGDVGQDDIEEVDRVVSGGNYGWNWKEGSLFFYYYPNPANQSSTLRFVSNTPAPGAPTDLIDPVGEYDHDEGFSVIGGYVYRGEAINTVLGAGATLGKYVFADLNGRLFEMNTTSGELREFSVPGGNPGAVTGFGQDADNELYLVTGASPGGLFKLTEAGDAPFSPSADGESAQCPPPEPGQEFCFPIVAENGRVASICL